MKVWRVVNVYPGSRPALSHLWWASLGDNGWWTEVTPERVTVCVDTALFKVRVYHDPALRDVLQIYFIGDRK